MALPRRARTIRGDGERGAITAEAFTPESDLRSRWRVRTFLSLPARVVAVLEGEIGQRIWLAGMNGGVVRGEFAGEDGVRPHVEDDVVQSDQQDVFILAGFEQRNTQQGKAAKVKRPRCFLGCEREQFGFTIRGWQVSEIGEADVDLTLRMDLLDGIAFAFTKGRPP